MRGERGWHLTAGAVTLEVTSGAPGYTGVYLVSAAETSGRGDVTPGATRPLSTAIGGGRYAFRCVLNDGAVLVGESAGSGAAGGPRPAFARSRLAPAGAVRAYRA